MERRALPLPSESLEARVAWYAAWLSVLLAAVALLPSSPLRVLVMLTGTTASVAVFSAYRRRATPVSSLVITVGAAFLSTATVIRLSGLPWPAGASFSQAGGVARPSAWLLTTTSWCLATGLLASGRLVVREGYRRGALRQRGYRVASLLPVVSFLGFLVVGAFQVGGSRAPALIHNLAAWMAMGAFWVGMLASPWLSSLSRALRYYSAGAAAVVFAVWLPCGLRFLGVTETSPVSTLQMELLVFALCFTWLGWLAREWSGGPND